MAARPGGGETSEDANWSLHYVYYVTGMLVPKKKILGPRFSLKNLTLRYYSSFISIWCPQTLVGFVSKLSQSLAIVDCATREMTFDPQCVIAAGYRPQVGDWVMIGVKIVSLGGGEQGRERGNEGRGSRGGNGEEEMVREEVEYVSPLREKETEGEVTFLCQSERLFFAVPILCIGIGNLVNEGK